MQIRLPVGRLLIAGALLLPMAASPSKLFTPAPGEVRAHSSASADGTVTVFTYVAPGAEARLLGSVASTAPGSRPRTTIKWLQRPGAEEPNLLGLERLYSHVLGTDPAGDFELELEPAAGTSVPGKAGLTQGEALRWIAEARTRAAMAVAAARSSLRPTPWRIATIARVTDSGTFNPDYVAVRAVDARGNPIAGVTLTATRGGDMICTARSDAQGLAACVLIDSHGHAPHEHIDGGPTIVTFPGVVSDTAIDLPTTLRIAEQPRPEFAERFRFPQPSSNSAAPSSRSSSTNLRAAGER